MSKSAGDVAGEAYQIIGALAAAAGLFETPEVQAALDYFSGDLSGEILAWSPPETGRRPNAAQRIMAGLEEAGAIARGEADPATYRVHHPKT